MRMRKYMAVLVSVLAVLVSCKKEASISSDKPEAEVPSEGGTAEFVITANYAWSASSSESWASVKEQGGSTLVVGVSKNLKTDPREATITLTCEGKTLALKIKQAQKDVVVSESGENSASVSWEEQDYSLRLSSNFAYKVSVPEADKSWLTVVGTKAMTASSLMIHVAENPEQSPRESLLVFKDAEGKEITTFSLIQNGRPQRLIIVHSLDSFRSPVLFGFGMSAVTDWGDGTTEAYNSNAVHNYNSGAVHTVTVDATGASTASLSDIIGIEEVDLSEF